VRAAVPHAWRTSGHGPIIPILIGSNDDALAASRTLRDRGFHVGAIRPPTGPAGTARLRLTLRADCDDDSIDGLIAALALSPAVLLLVRAVGARLLPPADPRVILDLERAALPGHVLVSLFATTLLASGLVAVFARRGVNAGRWLRVCFAVGALAAVAGVAVPT
jgi:hypothetical protein